MYKVYNEIKDLKWIRADECIHINTWVNSTGSFCHFRGMQLFEFDVIFCAAEALVVFAPASKIMEIFHFARIFFFLTQILYFKN